MTNFFAFPKNQGTGTVVLVVHFETIISTLDKSVESIFDQASPKVTATKKW
jgi:hypothetical protein